MSAKEHWEHVYRVKAPTETSWYQARPTRSLELLDELAISPSTAIIDVGGGASTLVDALLDRELRDITVLDISDAALAHAQRRLGERGASVTWIESDIFDAQLRTGVYDVWHDRAVFHFLTNAEDRRRYRTLAARALRPGGAAIIAMFARAGPPRCSGLDVVRYDAETLAHELGSDFVLARGATEEHRTPGGSVQAFSYAVLRRV